MTKQTLNKYIRELKSILCKDYDDEIPEYPRSKEFTKTYRKMIKSMIKKEGWELSPPSLGYCEVSFYIKYQDKYVYVHTPDYRFFPYEWKNNILIRTAKDEKDSHGGFNNYTTLEYFIQDVRSLFIWGVKNDY